MSLPRRKVVKVEKGGGMAIVDCHIDLWGKPRFTAGILVKEMRPMTVCKTFGVYKTEREAADAAIAALPNGESDRG